jgi:hypothetical protein
MPFVKGQSGNPGGRPKGASNKATAEARAVFMKLMNGQVEYIEAALEELRAESSEKYIGALSKMMPYFMPKQEHTEITLRGPHKAPSWFKDMPVNEVSEDLL